MAIMFEFILNSGNYACEYMHTKKSDYTIIPKRMCVCVYPM